VYVICPRALAVFGCTLLSFGCVAQMAENASPALDHVTIKLQSGFQSSSHFDFDGRKLHIANLPLRTIIRYTDGISSDAQLQGGPGWMATDKYNIDATVSGTPADRPVQQLLLQQLLRDWFKLAVHAERREIQGLAMVQAPGGPKLKVAKQASSGQAGFNMAGAGIFEAKSVTSSMLAQRLRQLLGAAFVVDQTGLTDRYDFTLHWDALPHLDLTQGLDVRRDYAPAGWAPSFGAQCREGQTPGGCYLESTVPPLNVALEAELGLMLKPLEREGDVTVVDHVERPPPAQ
jgi:uncharacterized protein (TIGR03435 family)